MGKSFCEIYFTNRFNKKSEQVFDSFEEVERKEKPMEEIVL